MKLKCIAKSDVTINRFYFKKNKIYRFNAIVYEQYFPLIGYDYFITYKGKTIIEINDGFLKTLFNSGFILIELKYARKDVRDLSMM